MLSIVLQMCRYAVIFVLWAVLFVMIYKVLTLEKDYIEYDPFEILQIDPVSSQSTRATVHNNYDVMVCDV